MRKLIYSKGEFPSGNDCFFIIAQDEHDGLPKEPHCHGSVDTESLARLIVSAPELYRAAKRIIVESTGGGVSCEAIDKLAKAIQKVVLVKEGE